MLSQSLHVILSPNVGQCRVGNPVSDTAGTLGATNSIAILPWCLFDAIGVGHLRPSA